MPIRSLSGSHQLPFRLLNVISVHKQPILLHGVWCAGMEVLDPCLSDSYQNPIRFFSDSNEAPIQIPKSNGRCPSDYHQTPIRLSSASFQIPQCNLIQFGANQLPISLLSDSQQKKFRFINAISILNHHTSRAAQPILISVLKQPLLLQGG